MCGARHPQHGNDRSSGATRYDTSERYGASDSDLQHPFVLHSVFSADDIDFLHAWRPMHGPRLELQRVTFLSYETQRVEHTGCLPPGLGAARPPPFLLRRFALSGAHGVLSTRRSLCTTSTVPVMTLCFEWSTQSAFHPAWSLLDHRRSCDDASRRAHGVLSARRSLYTTSTVPVMPLCFEWSTQSAFHPAWSLLDHRRSCDDASLRAEHTECCPPGLVAITCAGFPLRRWRQRCSAGAHAASIESHAVTCAGFPLRQRRQRCSA